MKFVCLLILLTCALQQLPAQIVLKPHIGLNSLPNDSDSMCYFEPYTGGFNTTGYQAGDTVNDFTLFSYNGDTLHLRRELEKGKPVVLVSCSYTCPVYRNKLLQLNNIYSNYSDSVSIFLIYTIEAHPYPDISPYFGYVNPGQQNISAGILFPLSRTYADRKQMAWRNDSALAILPPVFLDGTCDQWLRHFGPAPNNAYLITTQGIVFAKHAWFNRPPENLSSDIDSLFGIIGGGGGQYSGTFTFHLEGDSGVTGPVGQTIYAHGNFINSSDDTAVIRAIRAEENLPAGWASSICIDVCYPPTTDTAIFYLPPGDTQSYVMYFYTDSLPGSGDILMRFENVTSPTNSFQQRFYCTTLLSGISSTGTDIPESYFLDQNYPNPFNPTTLIKFGVQKAGKVTLRIYDLSGRFISELVNAKLGAGSYEVNFGGQNLPSGAYIYRIESDQFVSTRKMLLIK